ncbi:PQQ-dependent sugar dehydrogenase [Nocardia gipuzkoensis]|uniref:PQQ-dependent sugar dehydrogenase n=1 Tax=Nocardia gipuzkoensis TaxID=2749991 RepID=UPI001E50D345|nr:PQQ-dependent sugar dehydrogenase [Nocardia gipuzkoensis]MDE1668474.1 PQQ-dependent sugar dehydrogenase [Nocardia gipuzkoensis]UGT66095.1 PQQ-dependent sugar dehydrogenase [Nocardia gipuzkoensis]
MSLVVVGRVAASLALGSVLLVGCARFDDSASSPFTPEPTLRGANIDPKKPSQPPTSTTRPSGPCIDPDPAVVATCLDTTGGLVTLADGALVAERRTGRILKVVPEQPPVEIARLDVDGSGDGGLSDIALSPTYREDGLMYAYITTSSDNRVVRIAEGGSPKDVLTGIPKGATGNHGAIDFVSSDQMLVLTGDAGNPGAAASAGSLAGKLLRVNSPVPGRTPPPEIAASGIGTAGDVCRDSKDSIWITDRTAAEDRLQRLGGDGVVTTMWTWPDRPGVAGCAAATDGVAISLTRAKALAIAGADPNTHLVTAAPTLVAQDKYGQLGGAAVGADGTIWVTTVNKTDGQPGPFDDRVVRIPPPQAGGGGPD